MSKAVPPHLLAVVLPDRVYRTAITDSSGWAESYTFSVHTSKALLTVSQHGVVVWTGTRMASSASADSIPGVSWLFRGRVNWHLEKWIKADLKKFKGLLCDVKITRTADPSASCQSSYRITSYDRLPDGSCPVSAWSPTVTFQTAPH